ncbi:hypothetical protein [Ewingella americana]|uniref:Uncharacterized protein n=1 Tax=Ewingella americana TaxID=41202 RepID=A0A502G5S8_9GAMM|nr:hypothetical protein [Ewingella americana]TPG56750.1 hypothetical protein EAH77_21975 [Ewingella americana]
MHTHNVNSKTATTTPPERWGAKTVRHLIDRGHYNVACAQEAHAHDGEKFTRLDAYSYFIRGAGEAWVKVIRHAFRKKGRNV